MPGTGSADMKMNKIVIAAEKLLLGCELQVDIL